MIKPPRKASDKRYVLVEVGEARIIAQQIQQGTTPNPETTRAFVERMQTEEGGNFEDIAIRLKRLPSCMACQVESQEHNCESIEARRLGRRVWRLLLRALPSLNEETHGKI